MNHKQLEEFISKKQKVSDRNFQAFQESGVPRYMYAYQKAEELIDIARQALSAADDHQKAGTSSFYISQWGAKALELVNRKDLGREERAAEMEQLIRDIRSTAIMLGLVRDPYGKG